MTYTCPSLHAQQLAGTTDLVDLNSEPPPPSLPLVSHKVKTFQLTLPPLHRVWWATPTFQTFYYPLVQLIEKKYNKGGSSSQLFASGWLYWLVFPLAHTHGEKNMLDKRKCPRRQAAVWGKELVGLFDEMWCDSRLQVAGKRSSLKICATSFLLLYLGGI